MKLFAFLLFITLSTPFAAQNHSQSAFSKSKVRPAPIRQTEIYRDIEEMPVFPGGPEAMQKYLSEHLSHPAAMRGACSSRKLVASFVVNEDGSICQVEILKSINGCPDFDYEVIMAIKNMPKWIPGKLDGQNVRCYYKMPVYIS